MLLDKHIGLGYCQLFSALASGVRPQPFLMYIKGVSFCSIRHINHVRYAADKNYIGVLCSWVKAEESAESVGYRVCEDCFW